MRYCYIICYQWPAAAKRDHILTNPLTLSIFSLSFANDGTPPHEFEFNFRTESYGYLELDMIVGPSWPNSQLKRAMRKYFQVHYDITNSTNA